MALNHQRQEKDKEKPKTPIINAYTYEKCQYLCLMIGFQIQMYASESTFLQFATNLRQLDANVVD